MPKSKHRRKGKNRARPRPDRRPGSAPPPAQGRAPWWLAVQKLPGG
jgi:hypothetical protein